MGYTDKKIEKHEDEINHKIDETRSWDEIYTLRSKNNKDSINNLFNEEEKEKNIIKFDIKKEEKFSISNLADFLEEPLKFKYELLFKKDYSNDDEIDNSFEQFDIDKLSRSIIINSITLNLLKSYKEGILFDKDEYKNELKINHELSYILESIEDNEFEDFITMIRNRSSINFTAEVNPDDQILTLSTCADDYSRLVVHAVLVKN